MIRSRKTAALILISSGLAILALGQFLRWERGTPRFGTHGTPRATDRAIDERLAAIEKRIDVLSAQIQAVAAQGSPRRRAMIASPEQAERHDAKTSARAEFERNQRFNEFDAAFRAEKVDAAWAPMAEHDLDEIGMSDAILSIEASPPSDRRIECRAHTCRLKFTFPEVGDAEDWANAYATSSGRTLRQLQYMVQRQADGSAKVTMFGAR